MNTVNINRRVQVTLTKEGAKAINRKNAQLIDDILQDFPTSDCNFLKTDYAEGDVITDSLWYIFSMLGDYFYGNTNAPFVNNEINFMED